VVFIFRSEFVFKTGLIPQTVYDGLTLSKTPPTCEQLHRANARLVREPGKTIMTGWSQPRWQDRPFAPDATPLPLDEGATVIEGRGRLPDSASRLTNFMRRGASAGLVLGGLQHARAACSLAPAHRHTPAERINLCCLRELFVAAIPSISEVGIPGFAPSKVCS
jgi:hypothetical protein